MPAPSVRFTEIDESQLRVATGAVMAVVGPASKGPLQSSTLLRSEAQLEQAYGQELASNDAIAIARQILRAGGRVRFSRSVNFGDDTDFTSRTSVAATVTLVDRAGSPLDTLTITAKEEGSFANGVTVTIAAPTDGVATHFKMTISSPGLGFPAEVYDNIGLADIPNIQSTLWSFTDEGSATAAPDNIPALGASTLASGDDGVTGLTAAQTVGIQTLGTGIYALSQNLDFLDFFVPDVTDDAAHADMVTFAETHQVLAHLSMPTDLLSTDVDDFRLKEGTYSGDTQVNSTYAAYHYGALEFRDASSPVSATKLYDNSGGLGGALSYNDSVPTTSLNRPGPWLAASGPLRGGTRALSVSPDLAGDSALRDSLVDLQVNWFETVNGTVVARGNRTASFDQTKLTRYLNVRRGLLSLQRDLRPVVQRFLEEPNDPVLWRTAARTVAPILKDYVDNRAFVRATVQCDQGAKTADDAVLNTAPVRDAGIFKMVITVAPIVAVETVDIVVRVTSSGVQFEEL